ncbi:TPA: IS30 family transposase, partial [Escherichia coli]|nr:IS30 family transposase [Escherichia coli]HDL0052490.1 IS30 family transposase [Escherichia coli]
MSTSYRHLTINEREKIMILLAQGKKQAEIAKALGRSSSTISRELKRHALESYSATNAQNSYLKHRQNSKAQRKLEQPEYFNLVQEKFLTENWSPEQISARLKLEKSELSISYSTIYRG